MQTAPLPQRPSGSVNQDVMAELRRIYDKRLACLNEANAANRIAEFMNQDVKLNGDVIAGETL